MDKEQINVRVDAEIIHKIDELSEAEGRTKTSIVSEALSKYLGVDHKKSDIETLTERVRALESKFERLQDTKPKKEHSAPKKRPALDPDAELITIDQASTLTGYTVGTLSSKFSREGIQTVDRVDGNRAGLYSREEILDKIGKK